MPFTTTIRNWDANLHNFKGFISISGWCWAEISTMSSFPLFFSLFSFFSYKPSPICVGCHSQPSERPADWDRGRLVQPAVWVGCLPAPLTCAAQKGGWIMQDYGQEGVFSSPGPVCSWGCSSPLNRLPPLPKDLPHSVYRNSDVCFGLTAKTQQN